MAHTFTSAKKIVTALGMRMSKNDFGDYRVAFKSNNEKSAYYTGDLDDVVDTAIAMDARGEQPDMVTVASVNKEIRKLGIDAKLRAGRGYYYFTGTAVERAPSTSVYVYRVYEMTLAEWIKELNDIIERVI